MGRFTLPRDLYYGKDSLENLKNIDGKKAIVVSGGSSMRRGGFLDKVEPMILLYKNISSPMYIEHQIV